MTELAKMSDIPSIPDIPNVIDNLTSSSATDALSANQGRVLKNLISARSDYKIAFGTITTSVNSSSSSSFNGSDTITIDYSGSGLKTAIGVAVNGVIYDSRNNAYNAIGCQVQSFNATSATVLLGYRAARSVSSNFTMYGNYMVIGT